MEGEETEDPVVAEKEGAVVPTVEEGEEEEEACSVMETVVSSGWQKAAWAAGTATGEYTHEC